MGRTKVLFCTISLLLLSPVSLFADEIYLKNDTVFKGKVTRVTGEFIEYDPDGPKPFDMVPRERVAKIVYSDGSVVDFASFSESPEKETSDFAEFNEEESFNNFVFGISLGTPAFLNLMVGYHFNTFGVHISGLTFGADVMYGVQLNLLYNFSISAKSVHSLALVGGVMNIAETDDVEGLELYYGGLAYNLNFHGFFFELGLVSGNGTIEGESGTSIQAIFQIGYLHRFK